MSIAIPVLPETAPFTPAQRAWLNGFFAGLLNTRAEAAQPGPSPASAAVAAIAPAGGAAVGQTETEEFPWHDPALALDERLKLAEGRPHSRLLMAAMAQLDCGACGYLCQTYADSIAAGEEKDLTRCAPGGKETARKLRELVAAAPAVTTPIKVRGAVPAAPASKAFGRDNPCAARLLHCAPLNKDGSIKDTRHVVLDLKGSGVSYKAGDSLGVFPENCPDTVQWVLEALDASGAEKVAAPDGSKVTLRDALLRHYAVTTPTSRLVELLAEAATKSEDAAALKAMAATTDGSGGIPDGYEVLDLLTLFPSARPPVDQFVSSLRPMRPRLYSISSSPRAHPDEVHLTVGVVRFVNGRGRQCKGVASTFLGERIRPGQKVRVFVQPSHRFAPPEDAAARMIMVGPGTGIAPFRAFLQDRAAVRATGKNWLFFGDQRRDFDFLYEDELTTLRNNGVLTRLDTAFSRDQPQKAYVQHRMLENGRELWAWLQQGACFYVCGDAKRMAADVDEALRQIVAAEGGMSPEAATAYVKDLAKAKRYQRDVY